MKTYTSDIIPMFSGGSFGRISVNVRSIGGGESWDKYIAMTTSSKSETIGQALGNRDMARVAAVGKDYQLMDTTLVFEASEMDQIYVVRYVF